MYTKRELKRAAGIEVLIAALEEVGEDFTESLWGSMVEKVTVFEDGLVFTLTSDEEVKV